ncbi:copper amine oxidase N-terminal domain-containing protein [Paenibacillus sp. HWE-109]|uniref:copper amine oxidase N-terminal domain-containing protein n=1 Tax=Paenibacillus sp. HWE-109 TaxID=1306526 RepID=UPI001EDEA67B|nr:copper amine oxidase N-terminal domain-containing protein [Paenibacillus sp. HWE-109]UKS26397.1 copper amine oxidase N-terminal domain-containing protein [Paenibacillus sp. HWE-109]
MERKRWTWWVSASLVILMFALTGCQNLQGLDVSQAFQNSAAVKSGESRGSLQLELVPGDQTAFTANEKAIFNALKNVKLELTNVAMQDKQHLSVNGALTYSKGTIPFQASLDETQIVLQIEGAKQPIFFDLTDAERGSMPSPLTADMQKQIMDKAESLSPAILKFIIANAPNPSQIAVSSVSEQVYQETLSLQKLHLEIKGSELVGLLKTFLTNIIADDKGLKELIGQLYDVLAPIIKEEMKRSATENEFASPFPDLMMAYLDNKTLAVEFVYTTIQQGLQKVLKDWNQNVESSLSSIRDDQVKAFLSDKTVLKTDLFIDGDKQIRKVNAELSFPIADAKSGISAVKLTFVNETWNVNKPVKAASIAITDDALDLSEAPFYGSAILNYFKKDSQAYSLLRNDLQVAKEDIHLLMSTNDDADEYSFYDASHPFINEDNISMLPVRFLSERLGATVKWDDTAKQIIVKDDLTEKTIVFTLNSKSAQVNGTTVALESAAILKNGSTFVPLRFIAEQMGCKIVFDDQTQSVNLTRQ